MSSAVIAARCHVSVLRAQCCLGVLLLVATVTSTALLMAESRANIGIVGAIFGLSG